MELKTFIYEDKPVTFEIGTATMINATEMARPFGKEIKHWSENNSTTEFIVSLAKTRGISPNPQFANLLRISEDGKTETLKISDLALVFPTLVKVVKGGLEKQGTWLQEDVALFFAQWLSPEFYIWCNDRIKELLTKGTVSLPQDYLSALKALVAAEEEKQRLAIENKIMQPKAEYFDALVDRQLLTNFRDTAKELGLKQNKFIDWLIKNKYIYRDKKNNLRPYSNYANTLFEIKEYKSLTNSTHAGVQTLITPKGRATFKLLIWKNI